MIFAHSPSGILSESFYIIFSFIGLTVPLQPAPAKSYEPELSGCIGQSKIAMVLVYARGGKKTRSEVCVSEVCAFGTTPRLLVKSTFTCLSMGETEEPQMQTSCVCARGSVCLVGSSGLTSNAAPATR